MNPEAETAFDRIGALWNRELKELARRQEEIDQHMYDALCGEPFYTAGKDPRVKPVGLEDYLPIAQEKTMSNINTIEHHNEVICKAAREALIGTGLELMPFNYHPERYVMPSELTDALEIRIGVASASLWPAVRVVSRQQISNEAIYADDGAGLLAEVNRACMDARKVIHAQLTAIAAKVDPRVNCGREPGK